VRHPFKSASNAPRDQCERVPSKYRPLYLRAVAGAASPRQAIKAKCQECCGWEDLVIRVGDCTARTCPLWPLRPYQRAAEAQETAERKSSGTEVLPGIRGPAGRLRAPVPAGASASTGGTRQDRR
jgi:hypothetical protein